MPDKMFLVTLTTGETVSIPAAYERDWKAEARRLAETGVCDEENDIFYSARHIVSVQLQDPVRRAVEPDAPRSWSKRWFPLGQQPSETR